MIIYKHTQIGYLMLVFVLFALIFFMWSHVTARAESPSYYSGTNFAVTVVMVSIIFILASFSSLQVIINENNLWIKFSYGIFRKKFEIKEINSVKTVKNHWYYGWGIRFWSWPKMWIYNVSGFSAVEITMKDGKVYRIGTDVPEELCIMLQQAIGLHRF